MEKLYEFSRPFLVFLSEDPMLRILQGVLLLFGFFQIFLVFFATRDVLLRSRSFLLQCVAILLVAVLPVVGFLLYLLIRPARTLKERELEELLRSITVERAKDHAFSLDHQDFEEKEEQREDLLLVG
jgi:predicted phosphatase